MFENTNNKTDDKNNFRLELAAQKKETASSEFEQTESVPDWHDQQEGELAVDVISNEKFLIAISTMAGANIEQVSVNIHNDLLTIRGERKLPIEEEKYEVYHQECYWGPFSRSVVLPVDIEADQAFAEYKNGILKVFMPIEQKDRKVPINIVEK